MLMEASRIVLSESIHKNRESNVLLNWRLFFFCLDANKNLLFI